MDTEVSHRTLMALIYCLLERTKQVSKNSQMFFVLYLYYCIQVFKKSIGRYMQVIGKSL